MKDAIEKKSKPHKNTLQGNVPEEEERGGYISCLNEVKRLVSESKRESGWEAWQETQ